MPAQIGEERNQWIARARGEISKPTMEAPHVSCAGRSDIGQGSSAIFSGFVNCAQKFVNAKLVEGS